MSIEIRLPRPHAAQKQIIASKNRYNVICCGRRWGKTQLGIDRAVERALNGKPVGWFAPSYKYLLPVWDDLLRILKPVAVKTNVQDRVIKLSTGGSCEMWTLDGGDAGRSRAYARVIVDEAAMVRGLKEIWENAIRATLTDYRGDAWFLSTPKGISNFFHTLYRRGPDPNRSEWTSWKMPTASNPLMAKSEIAEARKDLTELAFQQEYLAEFVTWEGAVFRCISDAVYDAPENPHDAMLIGCDWGRTQDYTVFVGLAHDGRVVAMDRFRGIEYSLQRERLREFWQRVSAGRAYILAEVNSMGGPVVEQLMRDNLPVLAFNTTNASKANAIEQLALAFERGTIKIPNDPVLIGELQAFESSKLPSGMTRYQAPDGEHDDCVMALAIAWSGLEAAKSTTPSRVWADPVMGTYGARPPGGVQISPI